MLNRHSSGFAIW